MATTYAIFRSDNLHGTTDGTYLANLKIPTDLPNGTILKIGALAAGERDAFDCTLAGKTDALGTVAILAGPELMYDERKKNLNEYVNEVINNGGIYRAYILDQGDMFGLTAEGFDGTPMIGSTVGAVDGVLTPGESGIGKVIAYEAPYYVVRVGV